MPDNTVTAFGDQLFGLKGGVAVRMSPEHGTLQFNPSLGLAFNLDEGDRTSLFGDAEFAYTFVTRRLSGHRLHAVGLHSRRLVHARMARDGGIPSGRAM